MVRGAPSARPAETIPWHLRTGVDVNMTTAMVITRRGFSVPHQDCSRPLSRAPVLASAVPASGVSLTSFSMVADHSVERFGQVSALLHTLLLLLRSPQHRDKPWLAAAQLQAAILLAEEAAADIEGLAAAEGIELDCMSLRASLCSAPS